MGHKYSTLHVHSTVASFQANMYNGRNSQTIEEIADKLKDDCKIINSYPFRQRCKLCMKSMHRQSVILLECGTFRHKYHTQCMEKNNQHYNEKSVFKCGDCRDVLTKIFIKI